MQIMTRRLLWFVVGLALLVPWLQPVGRVSPVRLRVVDQHTGQGLPDLRVTVEHGPVGYTQFDGSVVFWLDHAVTKRAVRFAIEQNGVTTERRFPITPGGLETVEVAAH
jgi:hypothetical protein